ncbi:putative MFS family arabinose efflux permease [Arthrobacter sp. GAS37]|uniref:MFS transporter n=1 Tax=Arthrobacter sp. GAS37 TaxID=3156261 RepID=UPI00383758F5
MSSTDLKAAGLKSAVRSRGGLPPVVFVLTAGTFLMQTTEFFIAGLLPELASDLRVSVPRAGLLITVFAVGMIIGSPAMVILTLRLQRRLTLVLSLLLFAVGHVLVAVSPSFEVIFAARFVTACATGAFWSVAVVVATRAAGPAAGSRALGVVMGGGSLATVVGVPLGAFAGQIAGWRAPFWALAILAAGAAVFIVRFVPHGEPTGATPSLSSEFAALRSGRLWLALASCALIMGGVLATYSYIAPLLTDRAGVPAAMLPWVLCCFGVGALLGNYTGGRLGDHRPYATTITAAVAATLFLLALCVFSEQALPVVILITLAGFAGFVVNPVAFALAVKFAGKAPTLASALTTASFNFGIAAGSWAAGLALSSAAGETGPPAVGAAIASLTIVSLGVLAASQRRASRASANPGEEPSGESRECVGSSL